MLEYSRFHSLRPCARLNYDIKNCSSRNMATKDHFKTFALFYIALELCCDHSLLHWVESTMVKEKLMQTSQIVRNAC